VCTPSGDVGSIGVITAHEDLSTAQEMLGVKTTLIAAGKYKGEGHPFAPLDTEARAAIQRRVDEAYTGDS
jgi:ClpP class serine protease